jgi:hypothetical protein
VRKRFSPCGEPRGRVYRAIIEYSLAVCDRALLVMDESFPMDRSARRLLWQMGGYRTEVVRGATQWPGSGAPLWAPVTLYYFRLVRESADILMGTVSALYDWELPGLPEDLCLLRPDGSPWLISVSMCRLAWFEMDEIEKDRMVSRIPRLRLSQSIEAPRSHSVADIGRRRNYAPVRQPKGRVYRLVIHQALLSCDRAVLVDEGCLSRRGKSVVNMLTPYVLEKTRSSEWPGTRLPDGYEAVVYTFALQQGSAGILMNSVDRLYAWRSPSMPADLCLLRPDDTPWLVSVTYRAAAYFHLDPGEKHALTSCNPGIRLGELAPSAFDGKALFGPVAAL